MSLQNDDTNPLVADVVDETANGGHGPFPLKARPNVHPEISQGVSCGTPNPNMPLSGDVPDATAFNNSVPHCDTRYDDLDLPDAGNPQFEPDGGPLDPSYDFAFDTETGGTDSPFSILGGEDRLSSTSMETFTQNNTFHNCFACHNTQPIGAYGVNQDPGCLAGSPPAGCVASLIPFAAKINVSHMFSEFILREYEAAERRGIAVDAGGILP
jgi:hypothetical protein